MRLNFGGSASPIHYETVPVQSFEALSGGEN